MIRQHQLPQADAQRLGRPAGNENDAATVTGQRQIKGSGNYWNWENLGGADFGQHDPPHPPGVPLLMPGEMITEESRRCSRFSADALLHRPSLPGL
ncbi:hypothetical protein MJ579_05665 [Klebsiella pneumoniae]|nr:hypothetical protein MJ579_05665 [Klebsiella pneumoniae]